MINDFSEAATFSKKLPRFGMSDLRLKLPKFLTKILPQLGVYAFVTRLQKFCQKFCPSLDVISSLNMIARKMLESVVLPMSI